jgi:leader peptidase (prepilin peptidase)/N-methyltransferase
MMIRRQEGIGFGDVKLIAVLGAWLSISNLAPLLFYASLMGILYTISLNRKGSEAIAFGPFLIFSGIVVFYL